MKIVTILGARPQFVKAAAVSPHLRRRHREIIVHTGQHYDYNMSGVFFDQLGLPQPDHQLGVGSGPHGAQTGRMLGGIEEVLLAERPDWVLVYGDTNSTLAGTVAAAKLNIPVAHVEAGLRSYDRRIPEEINRVVADHLSVLLLAPTPTAVSNLAREGITRGVNLVGDVMVDVLRRVEPHLDARRGLLDELGVRPGQYALLTLHRPHTVDDPVILARVLRSVRQAGCAVVFPMHPRTSKNIALFNLRSLLDGILVQEPLSYQDMLTVERFAGYIITDSGGVQKEAYLFGVPCITLRPTTEWVETVETGWNRLVDPCTGDLSESLRGRPCGNRPPVFGDGHAGERVCAALENAAAGEAT